MCCKSIKINKNYDGHDYENCPNFVKGHVLNYISTIIELKYVITCALAKLNTMKKDLILT